ncbi:hypothetical protein [Intrasporangium sp.]|uniref:hypothetical protein n=1 Tax=Intrasporangium sp. TaxID=1925024 RepID=UPI00293A5746|nr:hypothetical protein [Intrasporangium sp.]MDV3221032.1 hypothetical protein [Intrasporangium sp.]
MTVRATTAPTSARGTLAALWGGLALTVVATVYPFADRVRGDVLADHIRASYPAYAPDEIDSAVVAYLVILSVIGALGTISWLSMIWAVRAGKPWVRWVAPVIFAIALLLALAGLTVRDTSGDVGLAPSLAALQLLPCVLGLVAVVLLWRKRQ